jgi:thymidylate synthase (FAD)
MFEMKVVEPSAGIITEPNPLKRIELCGRVCYKSEDRITPDSARKFVENIIKRGHTSVLEHARVNVDWGRYANLIQHFIDNNGEFPCGFDDRIAEYPLERFCIMNARDFIAIGGTLNELATFSNAEDYITARFICDRGIANELVRHRFFSFSQESTRYVNYKDGIEFVSQTGCQDITPERESWWKYACAEAETVYRKLIELGAKPQEARNVLPLSLKTELVMTGTYRQWQDMFALRTDKAAHPQMRYLMNLLPPNVKDKISCK